MAELIEKPARIGASGSKTKVIEEFIGCVNSNTRNLSIARMKSPPGWEEPTQQPEFDEYTVVLKGMLHVRTEEAVFDVSAGQAIIVKSGERVRYSSPSEEGSEYIAVCVPAFQPHTVHRDEQ